MTRLNLAPPWATLTLLMSLPVATQALPDRMHCQRALSCTNDGTCIDTATVPTPSLERIGAT
jgi:hypothetical protein